MLFNLWKRSKVMNVPKEAVVTVWPRLKFIIFLEQEIHWLSQEACLKDSLLN